MTTPNAVVMIRGGGDLASGVALRLHRAHYPVLITEVSQPLCVRRTVSFAEAIYKGTWEIEGVRAHKVAGEEAIWSTLERDQIPIVIDPEAALRRPIQPIALVDARMLKHPPELDLTAAPFVIGLGPGFTVGVDCHVVIETNRGHHMGRVYWQGQAQENTGIPGAVAGYDVLRVIRAPAIGELKNGLTIGSVIDQGDQIAEVGDTPVLAGFRGALRGLLHDGVNVQQGQKIGDLDPRADPSYCSSASDKSLAVAGGVLEALMVRKLYPPAPN
jgi:xanthine dehydrogenase accessory factor